jgi:YjbE family integral membrane protein
VAFLSNLLTIIAANLVLSGDNAIVIGLAASTLPRSQRMRALVAGATGAVVLLSAATIFVTKLLLIPFLKLAGGVFILWISLSLFWRNGSGDPLKAPPSSFGKAIWTILIADIAMSIDNTLAVAAVAEGDLKLLFLGLGVSIPIVVIASAVVTNLMDQPLAVYLGGILLGKIGADMVMTDSFVIRVCTPTTQLRYAVEAAAAIAVAVIGRLLLVRAKLNHVGSGV